MFFESPVIYGADCNKWSATSIWHIVYLLSTLLTSVIAAASLPLLSVPLEPPLHGRILKAYHVIQPKPAHRDFEDLILYFLDAY